MVTVPNMKHMRVIRIDTLNLEALAPNKGRTGTNKQFIITYHVD